MLAVHTEGPKLDPRQHVKNPAVEVCAYDPSMGKGHGAISGAQWRSLIGSSRVCSSLQETGLMSQ